MAKYQSLLSFTVKTQHFFKDKTYTVSVYEDKFEIQQGSEQPKYIVSLQIQNTLYWQLNDCKEIAFGFAYKFLFSIYKQSSTFKYFFAEENDLANFRTSISGKIAFFQHQSYFQQFEMLGKGAFSQVVRVVRQKDGKQFALKILSNDLDALNNEVQVLRQLKELEGVIKVHEVLKLNQSQYGILMEYFQGTTLEEVLEQIKVYQFYQPFNKKFKLQVSEMKLKRMFEKLLIIIREIHRNKIVHNDLKPTNILISHDYTTLQVIDFGLSTFSNRKIMGGNSTIYGTPGFIAPELFLTKKHTQEEMLFQSDTWSLGIIFFQFLNRGRDCFKGEDVLRKNISCDIQYNQIDNKFYSQQAIDLLHQMTQLVPEQRISIRNAIAHPFFFKRRKNRISTEYKEIMLQKIEVELAQIEQEDILHSAKNNASSYTMRTQSQCQSNTQSLANSSRNLKK